MTMQINFIGHHMEVTPALREFTQEKMHHCLEHHANRITRVNVTFSVEKLRQIAEAKILIRGGEIHASSESADMYSAVDSLIDKVERQLIKSKEKEIAHRGD